MEQIYNNLKHIFLWTENNNLNLPDINNESFGYYIDDGSTFKNSFLKGTLPSSIPKFNNIKFITNKKKTSFIISKEKTKMEQKNNKKSAESNGRWTQDERIKFAHSILKFGANWKKFKYIITTRNLIQIKSHSQKFLIKLKKSEDLIKKGIKLDGLNWVQSLRVLRDNYNDFELLNILISIESELGDNKRMTQKYLEKKHLLNLKNELMYESTGFSSLEENNNNIIQVDLNNKNNIIVNNINEVFDKNKGKNNDIMENSYENDNSHEITYRKNENFYENENISKQNIFLDKYLNNLNHSIIDVNNNNFDFEFK